MVESKKHKGMVFETEGELAKHLMEVGPLTVNDEGLSATIYYDGKFRCKYLHVEKPDPISFGGWIGVELTPLEEPKYRPFKMEEDDEYLGLKIKSKTQNTYLNFDRRILSHVQTQGELDRMFREWDQIDGKPVGKLIEQ